MTEERLWIYLAEALTNRRGLFLGTLAFFALCALLALN
jgi:hypothetical protein